MMISRKRVIFYLKYRKHSSVYPLHEATKLTDFNETYVSDRHISDKHHIVHVTEKSKLIKHRKFFNIQYAIITFARAVM